MASAVHQPSHSATSELQAPRSVQLFRAVVLFIAGMAITFTATMHEDIAFDTLLIAGSLALIAVATFYEYYAMRGTLESWWIAARAIIALGAAGALIAVGDTVTMALVVAVWAGLTALITLLRLVRGAQPRRVALPSLILSVVLTVSVLLVRNDPVATIGFFGAYAVVRGVFLAIAAFDSSVPADNSQIDTAFEAESMTNSGNRDD